MRKFVALAILVLTLLGGVTAFIVNSNSAQAAHRHGGGCEGERFEDSC
jgi:hypothetical protein